MSVSESPPVSISIVVPVYSGEEYLRKLTERVDAVRQDWQARGAPMAITELIFVDDAAVDGSGEIIDALARDYIWVTALHLSRNFGQHPATVAGILFTAGSWVVTMDEDLQHPPEKIVDLLERAIRDKIDVVYAQPDEAVHKNFVRDIGSSTIKRTISWLTGSAHVRIMNSFRLMRGEIARSAASVAIHDTYFDIELGFFTQRIAGLPMQLVDERFIRSGKSGYKLRSLVAHAWRMVFSANLRVLRFAAILGAFTSLLAIGLAALFIITNLFVPEAVMIRGWASQIVATMFFGGVNVALVGIALQYLSTLVLRAHGQPTFFVIDRASDRHLQPFFDGREG